MYRFFLTLIFTLILTSSAYATDSIKPLAVEADANVKIPDTVMTNVLPQPDILSKNKAKQNTMTNYQYDEANYHYYKVNNLIKDNLDYANSSRMKY